jgi:hypothetical protein
MKSETTKTYQRKIQVLPYVIATAVILLFPFIAMQFSDDVQWGIFDFVLIGALLLGAGLWYEFVSMKLKDKKHRLIAAVVTVVAVMYIWAELAVGIFTNWGS